MHRIKPKIKKYAIVSVTFAIALVGCSNSDVSTATDAEEGVGPSEVTLSVVLPFQPEATELHGYKMFVEKLAEDAPWITIESRGGPESIPAFDQPEAVASGVVDMMATPTTYLGGMIPMVEGDKLSPLTPSEAREQGVYDFWEQLHNDVGLHFLGQTMPAVPSKLWLNEPIDTADLSGMQIRTSGTMQPLVESLNGSAVAMDPGETYTALERGVVDGVGWVAIGMSDFGWDEVVSYELDEPFFHSGSVSLVVNHDTWDSLDEETRAVMTETMSEVEDVAVGWYEDRAAEEMSDREAAGVEVITLPKDESERFAEAAEDAGWDELLKVDPEKTQELRQLYGLD